MSYIPWLDIHQDDFPPTHQALDDPNGLLAAGGDLSPARLVHAYSLGIFPWFSEGEPLLWWSPSPRCVLYPDQVHTSKSLKKLMRKGLFTVTIDQQFEQVIQHCGDTRQHEGTWITEELSEAFINLHHQGYAHSVECWQEGELVGGLYGMTINRVFFGESMFSLKANASKVALVFLCERLNALGYSLLDCQVKTDHLVSMGAIEIPREDFESVLYANREKGITPGKVKLDRMELDKD
ncbi:leucyl/phenylalanyl-tRNA--protein transferase [Marinibactrum halimedae]|uniref:Leucyl/phenylalanyl-tRNA--protein transferase n=1 Tax=Marinibactrum halimedae TaxID=1444977 RepID=A0AA37WND3_9GAMM|nr:leucyl/phenylalanyl-tRNA--protein transferase [Marinibactrum halimedae]MCD9460416.1 leucyl/phenylalanyl-tRNA--protein transferase [Marinibactrum halimedae]GLS27453.1 leucyl/phenylalanyl-tRNA--protein transferase [Marinibactrum halimedae]